MNTMTLPPLAPASETVDYDPFEANEIQRVVATTEAQREIWLADRISPPFLPHRTASIEWRNPAGLRSEITGGQPFAHPHEGTRFRVLWNYPEGRLFFTRARNGRGRNRARLAKSSMDHRPLSLVVIRRNRELL